jgi:two-component system, OmpR family, phosphate regulon sensor histidine kinase PhoR
MEQSLMSSLPKWKGQYSANLVIAVTVILGAAFLPVPWVSHWDRGSRVAATSFSLIVCGSGLLLLSIRQRHEENKVRRYVDLLCRLDYHELTSSNLANSLPQLSESNPWRSVFNRIRESLSEYSRRLQDAEQMRASAEVRVRRLVQERQQIADILEGLSTPVLAVDHYGELTLSNASANELLGIQRNGEARCKLEESLNCEPLVRIIQETQRRKNATQRLGELEIVDESGVHRSFRVVCRSVNAESGGAEHGTVAVLTDISDQKAIQKRNAEFVSAVSHEMKTPLAGIKAYVELLADGEAEDEETREEFLGVINSQADRLQRLIDNLLNLARIEAGVVDVNKQILSLNELLQEAKNVVQPAAERKHIDLRSELSPMYLSVHADRDMLLQSAINLLSNAIKYTPDHGGVTLRSRMIDNQIQFEVADTGVGLNPEDCKKVFEKFYRVKKDRNMASGTGLGLPLAKHIVEDVHGGTITVESELGRGSTFRVSLPCPAKDK